MRGFPSSRGRLGQAAGSWSSRDGLVCRADPERRSSTSGASPGKEEPSWPTCVPATWGWSSTARWSSWSTSPHHHRPDGAEDVGAEAGDRVVHVNLSRRLPPSPAWSGTCRTAATGRIANIARDRRGGRHRPAQRRRAAGLGFTNRLALETAPHGDHYQLGRARVVRHRDGLGHAREVPGKVIAQIPVELASPLSRAQIARAGQFLPDLESGYIAGEMYGDRPADSTMGGPDPTTASLAEGGQGEPGQVGHVPGRWQATSGPSTVPLEVGLDDWKTAARRRSVTCAASVSARSATRRLER